MLTWPAWDRPVSIRQAARPHSGAQLPLQTAPRLVAEVGKIKGSDDPPDTDLDLIGGTIIHGDQLDAGELHFLPELWQTAHTTRQAVEILHHHQVAAPCQDILAQQRESRAAMNRSQLLYGFDHLGDLS